MREYSNAFNRDRNEVCYNKYMEIFNSGVVYYGMQEYEFLQIKRPRFMFMWILRIIPAL